MVHNTVASDVPYPFLIISIRRLSKFHYKKYPLVLCLQGIYEETPGDKSSDTLTRSLLLVLILSNNTFAYGTQEV